MAIFGEPAYRLLTHILREAEPHLPAGVHIKITPHRRWTTLQRADDRSINGGPLITTTDERGRPRGSRACGVRGLGAWIPFLPRGLSRRITAQDAAEVVLELAYYDFDTRTDHRSDLRIRAETHPDGVIVSYSPPDHAQERVALGPIPNALL